MKITKAQYDEMPAWMKGSFTVNSNNADEYTNGEENVDGLKSALDKEKEEKRKIAQERDAFKSEQDKKIDEARKQALADAREKGEFKPIEDDYKRQLKQKNDELEKMKSDATNAQKDAAIAKVVDSLAEKFVSPALAKLHIKTRLSADIVDGETIVRVLSKDGKASALSVDDLKKEFSTDPELKGSLAVSKGSGGGTTQPTSGGGATEDTSKPFDAANATPKELAAHLKEKYGNKASVE